MEEEKGAVPGSGRGSSSFPPAGPPPVASSSAHAPTEDAARASSGHRQRFSVDLRPGETTIVSWKRLVRDANKANAEPPAPSGAHPVLESRIAPAAATQPMESENNDAQPPSNRFSAVIEKIERLYMGRESSDEELDDVPDDDQYDTDDSFIDDSELNEYFEVEKSATKHNGFFVNRGALERIEPSLSAPNLAPKKRRRKDSTKVPSMKGAEHMTNELVNVGNVRMKAAARNAPLGKKSSPTKVSNSFSEHIQEGKILKNKSSTSVEIYKRKSTDPTTKSNSLPLANVQNKDVLASFSEEKNVQNQKSAATQSIDAASKLRKSEPFDALNLSSREKGVTLQAESQCILNKENDELFSKSRRMEKNGTVNLPDLNTPGNIYSSQGMKSSRVKEGSGIIRPKGTTLERAIRDLEKIVSTCRPPNMDVQEWDASSQVVKKRLPQEVKPRLAKVARLAASQGKVKAEDLLDRLMSILGHLVSRKTLKRNLKEMVELGLSAKQIKADRFQQIKKEITEMIKMRIMNSKTKVPEQQDSLSDDFQEVTSEERRSLKVKYSMDDAIEDKIYDLYDLYVEGMDEDKGPQMRKLYVELAELWPTGYMDNVGIKDAILRAKERKKALHRQQGRNEERMKRKKMTPAIRMEDHITLGLQAPALQDVLDSNAQVLTSADKVISGQPFPPSGRIPEQITTLNGSSHLLGSKNADKARGSGVSMDEGVKADAAVLKKKLKRKSETESEENYVYPVKPPCYPGKEKTNASKA